MTNKRLCRYNGSIKTRHCRETAALPHCLRINLDVNFVPGEYFNGLLDLREPTFKIGTARTDTEIVSLEREGQQLRHQGLMR